MAVKIEHPNVLVVEGKDDELFFGALIGHLGLQSIQVLPIGGKGKLRRNLKLLVKSPDFHKVLFLGIVRDADEDPKAAFQTVCDALRTVNLPAPPRPWQPFGTSPKVTVLILPGGNMQGMLEDLCLKAVEQDPAMLCVEQYFECLQDRGLSLPNNVSKAKVQAFLASRQEAGLRLGEAAQAGYWPLEADAFEQVRDFLRQIIS